MDGTDKSDVGTTDQDRPIQTVLSHPIPSGPGSLLPSGTPYPLPAYHGPPGSMFLPRMVFHDHPDLNTVPKNSKYSSSNPPTQPCGPPLVVPQSTGLACSPPMTVSISEESDAPPKVEINLSNEGAFELKTEPPMGLESVPLETIVEALKEAQEVLRVTYVKVGDWIIVLRQESDVCLEEFEPHWAVTFIFHLKSGEYRQRIFDRSVTKGRVSSCEELKEALWSSFLNVRPCRGLSLPKMESQGQSLVPIGAERLKFPYERAMSSNCMIFYKSKNPIADNTFDQCQSCREFEKSGALIPEMNADPDEIMEEDDTPLAKKPTRRGRKAASKGRKSQSKKNMAQTNGGDPENPTFDPMESRDGREDDHVDDDDEDSDYVPKYRRQRGHEDEDDKEQGEDEEDADEDDEDDVDIKEELSENEDENGSKPAKRARRKKKSRQDSLDDSDCLAMSGNGRGGLACTHCDKLFRDKTSLKRHLRFVNRMHVYKCHGCDYECKTLALLLDHISTDHKDKMHEFSVFFREDDEAKSMKEPKKCGICDMIFNGHNLLHRHRNQSHFLGDYRCDQCQEPQLTHYDLQLHLSKEHLQTLEKIIPDTHGLERQELEDGRIKFKRISFTCEVCQQPFPFDSSCDNHKRKEHLWGTFACSPCGLDCHFAKDMIGHVRNFHPDNPEVTCPICQSDFHYDKFLEHYEACVEASFKAKSKLASTRSKMHYQRNKDKMKRPSTPSFYQCDECGKSFKSKVIFKGHLHSHRGTEKYKCEECDYTTHFKAVMTDHRKMHLRAKGFTNGSSELVLYQTCHICGKQFAQMQGLKKHIEGFHEGIKRERPCEECGKIFNSSGAYYHHKRKVHGFVSNRTRCGKQKF